MPNILSLTFDYNYWHIYYVLKMIIFTFSWYNYFINKVLVLFSFENKDTIFNILDGWRPFDVENLRKELIILLES